MHVILLVTSLVLLFLDTIPGSVVVGQTVIFIGLFDGRDVLECPQNRIYVIQSPVLVGVIDILFVWFFWSFTFSG